MIHLPRGGFWVHVSVATLRQSAKLAAKASDNCASRTGLCVFTSRSDKRRNHSSFGNPAEMQSGPNEAAWQDRGAALHWHLLPNFKASFEAAERRSTRSPGNTDPLHSPLLANVLWVEAGRMPKADQRARGRGAAWLTVVPTFAWIDNRCSLLLWVPERKIQYTSQN